MKKIESFGKRKVLNPFLQIKFRITDLCFILLLLFWSTAFGVDGPDAILHSRGYTLIPAPQQVNLGESDVVVDGSWQLLSQVGNDIAVKELIRSVELLHGLKCRKL